MPAAKKTANPPAETPTEVTPKQVADVIAANAELAKQNEILSARVHYLEAKINGEEPAPMERAWLYKAGEDAQIFTGPAIQEALDNGWQAEPVSEEQPSDGDGE